MNTSNPSRTFSWNICASPQRHRACRNADRIAVACSMWGAFRMSAPLGVMLRGGQSCVCIELATGHGFLDVAIQKNTTQLCNSGLPSGQGRLSHSPCPASLFSHADEVIRMKLTDPMSPLGPNAEVTI